MDNFPFTQTMPPRIQEVRIYFIQQGMPEIEADHFFLFYDQRRWRNKKEIPYKRWKDKAWSWIFAIYRENLWLLNRSR